MKPSDKAPAITELLESISGRSTAIASNKYVTPPLGCGRTITESEMSERSDLTRREYTISGMCNTCQDAFFGM